MEQLINSLNLYIFKYVWLIHNPIKTLKYQNI